MKDTWLIQRLSPPPKSAFSARASQVFGGGMLQLKPEAWKILQSMFDIEYMGAAEFEFGTLPLAMQAFARDAPKLIAFPHRTRRNRDLDIWVLCREEHKDEVIHRIELLANNGIRLKEHSNFQEATDPNRAQMNYPPATCGWFELNNGFFFFTDKIMWEKATKLYRDGEVDDEVLEETDATP